MTSTAAVPTVTLNDENTIPVIGLGVAELSDERTELAVTNALAAGYRLIDTASVYGNEAAVGRAIAASGVPRSELFVTTKVWVDDLGVKATEAACEASLGRLGLDYLDLYLIHWPAPALGKWVEAYGGLMQVQGNDLVRSIGVCNFSEEQVDIVSDLTFCPPVVNQIELHPLLNQAELRAANAARGVVTEAFSPLAVGRLISHPAVVSIAKAHGKTPAQALIRWSIQLGNVVIPRSATPEHIASNIDVFGFELTDDDMAALDALNDGTRIQPDPLTFNGLD